MSQSPEGGGQANILSAQKGKQQFPFLLFENFKYK